MDKMAGMVAEGWNTEGINRELLEISAEDAPEQVEEQAEQAVETPEEPAVEEPAEVEEDELEEEPKQKPQKADHVPLSKYMETKNELKDLRNKLKDMERDNVQRRAQYTKAELEKDYVARGWPEAEAKIMAEKEVASRIEMDEIRSRLLDLDIKELSQSDPFYADAMTFKKEIRAKMREKGMDVEEAYIAVRGKTRLREFELEKEQRAAARRRPPAQVKKVQTASATQPKPQYQLDDADRKALKGLQKAMPDAQWDEKKYWEVMKKE